jgi:UDP-glucose 4-epimerase
MVNNILISGGEGFLGSHFCERLLANGHEVLRVGNFFEGSKTDVKHLLGNPRFELIRHMKEARIFNTYRPRMHPDDLMNATERCTIAELRGR